MIIPIVALFTVLTFVCFVYIKPPITRWIAGSFAFLLLTGSILMIVFNFTHGFGMKEVTTITEHEIFSAGDLSAPYGLIIKTEVGENSGNFVFVYRNSKDESAKPTPHFQPDTSNIIETTKKTADFKEVAGTKASVKTVTVRRVFSSEWMNLLFGIGGENKELVSEHSTVSIPKDTWLILTQKQAEDLEKEAPELAAEQKAQLLTDPQKAMALEILQKSNPTEFAKMQVTQIKELLGVK